MMMSKIFILAVMIAVMSTRLMNCFNHGSSCPLVFHPLDKAHITQNVQQYIYFNPLVNLKKLSWHQLSVYFHSCDPVSPLNKTAAMQTEGTIFFPWVTTSAPNPLVSCTLILSLQLLLHASSKSFTQLSVVIQHVSPDLWHTASRKALQGDWSSSQKVLEERFNFQRAHHFRFQIAVFMHWTAFIVLILHRCPS